MPLNELLAMYGYESEATAEKNGTNSTVKPTQMETDTKEQESSPPAASKDPPAASVPTPPLVVKDDEEEEEEEAEIITVSDEPPDVPSGSGPLLRSVSQASESSDTGTDDDYSPDDDWRKTIQVGFDYQAVIPDGLCKYDDAPAYENEDRLLWDPTKLTDEQVEEYLRQSQQPYSANAQGVNAIPTGNHIRDDEQALFLLLQCGHNMDEALRRRRMQPLHPADTMSLWSEDECRSFETGLKTYGKDFHLIQQNKVRTRSVGELVQFYYLWKKTERHDVFASKNRLEKKKYSLHPGTTDYMDRFLDEQENPMTHRDRSSSPSMHSLMFGENRKRTPASSPPAVSVKSDASADHAAQPGTHAFLDALYPATPDKSGHLHSPSKVHSGNPLNDCNKEYLNGEDRLSTTNTSREKCPPMEVSSGVHSSGNLSNQLYGEKSPLNPPNDVLSCSRHTADSSRLHDPHVESRFDTCREVTSIE